MHKALSHGCIVLFAFLAIGSAHAEVVIHVAPNGDDANPGTVDKPVRAPLRARDLVRSIKAKSGEPITVQFAPGTYYLADTFLLGPEDSGTEKAPVTYVASTDGPVILSGGMKLDLTWKPYKDGIMQAGAATRGDGKGTFDQLFVNGRNMPLARYPNYNADARPFNGTAADAISPERVKRWANPVGAYVHALHANDWGDFHYRIIGVDDKGNAKLEGGWQNNRRTGMHKQHRFVENVFEELDAPGEWYHDAAMKRLYFYPPKDVDLKKATVETAGLRHLVEFRGTRDKPVRFVVLKGFTFTHAARTFMDNREPLLRSDWTIYRGGAVVFEGSEDCGVDGCFFDQVGGNAVFVNKYNRHVAVTTCKIVDAGASGVCFVGDPKAVRSPLFEYNEKQALEQIDRTPGPKTEDYPAKCRVHDCLIHGTGRVEKQSAGVEISMSEEITVSHCSIYEVPRAGINIGDGCWGGHVIAHNDVFDTVRETGDHGSFNSWGRDRYWLPNIGAVNQLVAKNAELPLLDCCRPIVLRNNRWRCDHGWDIDLDDGSTNYTIENNLCLHGGLKLREGYQRTVENNVLVDNSFHPHVWFENSGDVFRHNVLGTKYHPIGMPKIWGKEVNANFFVDDPSLKFARNLGLDSDSLAGDPQFRDAPKGDYRVKDGSAALKAGFKNFAMDEFGVVSPRLRKEAQTPRLPDVKGQPKR